MLRRIEGVIRQVKERTRQCLVAFREQFNVTSPLDVAALRSAVLEVPRYGLPASSELKGDSDLAVDIRALAALEQLRWFPMGIFMQIHPLSSTLGELAAIVARWVVTTLLHNDRGLDAARTLIISI